VLTRQCAAPARIVRNRAVGNKCIGTSDGEQWSAQVTQFSGIQSGQCASASCGGERRWAGSARASSSHVVQRPSFLPSTTAAAESAAPFIQLYPAGYGKIYFFGLGNSKKKNDLRKSGWMWPLNPQGVMVMGASLDCGFIVKFMNSVFCPPHDKLKRSIAGSTFCNLFQYNLRLRRIEALHR